MSDVRLVPIAVDLVLDPDAIAEQAVTWIEAQGVLRFDEFTGLSDVMLAMKVAAVKAVQLTMAEVRETAASLADIRARQEDQ